MGQKIELRFAVPPVQASGVVQRKITFDVTDELGKKVDFPDLMFGEWEQVSPFVTMEQGWNVTAKGYEVTKSTNQNYIGVLEFAVGDNPKMIPPPDRQFGVQSMKKKV